MKGKDVPHETKMQTESKKRKYSKSISSESLNSKVLAVKERIAFASCSGYVNCTESINNLERCIKRVLATRKNYRPDVDYFAVREKTRGAAIYCSNCKNRNQDFTFLDVQSGDLVCMGVEGDFECGFVLYGSHQHQGAEKINYDGEQRHHHGSSLDPTKSELHNLATVVSTTDMSGRAKSSFKALAIASERADLTYSPINNDEQGRTSIAYKDHHKAATTLKSLGGMLQLSSGVIDRAVKEFCRYRDVVEKLHHLEGISGACLYLAYKEIMENWKPFVPLVSNCSTSRDQSILAPRLDAADPASSLSHVSINSWSVEDCQLWLTAVASNLISDVTKRNHTIARVIAELQSALVQKSTTKYAVIPSFLGTTTISGRAAIAAKRSAQAPALQRNAGQILVTFSFRSLVPSILSAEEAAALTKAVRRRVAVDRHSVHVVSGGDGSGSETTLTSTKIKEKLAPCSMAIDQSVGAVAGSQQDCGGSKVGGGCSGHLSVSATDCSAPHSHQGQGSVTGAPKKKRRFAVVVEE